MTDFEALWDHLQDVLQPTNLSGGNMISSKIQELAREHSKLTREHNLLRTLRMDTTEELERGLLSDKEYLDKQSKTTKEILRITRRLIAIEREWMEQQQ